MTIQIACPHCRRPLQVPAAAESATIQCPHCRGLARVPKVGGGEAPAPKPAVKPAAPRPPTDPALNPWAGITAMVVGIVGLVVSCAPMCGLPLCLIAVVLGWVGLKHYKAGRGMATAGLALGVSGIALSIVATIVFLLTSAGPMAWPASSP